MACPEPRKRFKTRTICSGDHAVEWTFPDCLELAHVKAQAAALKTALENLVLKFASESTLDSTRSPSQQLKRDELLEFLMANEDNYPLTFCTPSSVDIVHHVRVLC